MKKGTCFWEQLSKRLQNYDFFFSRKKKGGFSATLGKKN